MALPPLPFMSGSPAEKQGLNLLEDQKNLLAKISKSIVKSTEETTSLRKDMSDLKKEFKMNMNEFSSLKEFISNMGSKQKIQDKIETTDRIGSSSGGLKGLITRLFTRKADSNNEPSLLQTNLIDEFRIVKQINLRMSEDIKFIKQNYEEKNRAKERTALAEAIANAINSDKGGGFGKWGTVILGGLAALGVTLGSIFVNSIGAVKDVLVKIAEFFPRLLGLTGLGAARSGTPGTPGTPAPDADRKSKPTQKPEPRSSGSWTERLKDFGKGTMEFMKKWGSRLGFGLALGGTAAMAVQPSELGDSSREGYLENLRKRDKEKYDQVMADQRERELRKPEDLTEDALSKGVDMATTKAAFDYIKESSYGKEKGWMGKDYEGDTVAAHEMRMEAVQQYREIMEGSESLNTLNQVELEAKEEYLQHVKTLNEEARKEAEKKEAENKDAEKLNTELKDSSKVLEDFKAQMKALGATLTDNVTADSVMQALKRVGTLKFHDGEINLFDELMDMGPMLNDMLKEGTEQLMDIKEDIMGSASSAPVNIASSTNVSTASAAPINFPVANPENTNRSFGAYLQRTGLA